MSKNKGFTLIELMIVVAVIGIIAAIALPSYEDYVMRARRADAKTALLNVQLAQEKWRANNTTYGALSDLGISSTSDDGYYGVAVSGATATAYSATATAQGSQAADTDCGNFSINQDGTQSVSGSLSASACWNR